MKRRGFLKAMFSLPAIPYVPVIAPLAAPVTVATSLCNRECLDDLIWEVYPEDSPFVSIFDRERERQLKAGRRDLK